MSVSSIPQGPTPSPAQRPQPIVPALTVEEEDSIIHARITNDERPLRRVIKKFHNYTSIAHVPIVPSVPTLGGDGETSVDDVREAFLVELESFHLSLKKSVMICEAEARQVEEYLRDKQRIEDEHGKLLGQIEQLKTSLEHEQIIRRRKIEYDVVAEKVNALPGREELEQTIQALENDMEAIRMEHDLQNRTIQGQKTALDTIVLDLGSLRFLGKDKDTVSHMGSPATTPAVESGMEIVDENAENGDTLGGSAGTNTMESGTGETGEIDEKEDREEDKASSDDVPLSLSLNPAAKPFHPSSGTAKTPREEEDDIEMGEVAEDPKNNKGKRKIREELEEGEASDSSSALSDPPDD